MYSSTRHLSVHTLRELSLYTVGLGHLDDPEAWIGGSLQSKISNDEEHRSDGNEQTGTFSDTKDPSIVRLYDSITL